MIKSKIDQKQENQWSCSHWFKFMVFIIEKYQSFGSCILYDFLDFLYIYISKLKYLQTHSIHVILCVFICLQMLHLHLLFYLSIIQIFWDIWIIAFFIRQYLQLSIWKINLNNELIWYKYKALLKFNNIPKTDV